MRDGPDDSTLAGGVSWRPVLSSWLADSLLADAIPAISGRFSFDVTQQIPERLTFVVPEVVDGVSWIPEDPSAPLARFGQQVSLIIEVTSPISKQDWQVQVATLQVQDWQHDDVARTVTVEAVGLFQIAADASFITPEAPRTTDTFVSAFTRLLAPTGLGVNFDASLVDRSLPQSFQWDQDRLTALYDIADAWPARIRVDEYGTVQVLPPLGDISSVVMSFTQGDRGTLITSPSSDTRDQVYNVVVCTSSATDSPSRAPVQGVAQVVGGPLDPATYGAVVRYYSSPLVVSAAQCQAAAQALLQQSILPAIAKIATIAPDPRPEVDDPVGVVQFRDDEQVVTFGYVIGYDMPLTVDDGEMQVTVGSPS